MLDRQRPVIKVNQLKFLVIIEAFIILHYLLYDAKNNFIIGSGLARQAQSLQVSWSITVSANSSSHLVPFDCFAPAHCDLLGKIEQDSCEFLLDLIEFLLPLEQLFFSLLNQTIKFAILPANILDSFFD